MTSNRDKVKRSIATTAIAAGLVANQLPHLRSEQQSQATPQRASETNAEREVDMQVQNVLKLIKSQSDKFRCLGIGNDVATEKDEGHLMGKGWQGPGSYVFILEDGSKYMVKWKLETEQQAANWNDIVTAADDWKDANSNPVHADKVVKDAVKSAGSKKHNIFKTLADAPVNVVKRTEAAIHPPAPPQIKVEAPAPPQVQIPNTGQIPVTVQIPPSQTGAATTMSNGASERISNLSRQMSPEALRIYLGFGNEAPLGAQTFNEKENWKGNGFYAFAIDGKPYTTPYLADNQQFWNWCLVVDGRERSVIVVTQIRPSEEFERIMRARTVVAPTTPTEGLSQAEREKYLGMAPNRIPLPGTQTHAAQDGWQGQAVYVFNVDGKSYPTPVVLDNPEILANWGLVMGKSIETKTITMMPASKEVIDAMGRRM